MLDRSAQNTVRYNSVAVSTKSIDAKMRQEELDRARKASEIQQKEVEELKMRIRELDQEVARQKDQYMRKSSAKLPSVQQQNDPELERMRTFIRELEEETSDLKRQLAQA